MQRIPGGRGFYSGFWLLASVFLLISFALLHGADTEVRGEAFVLLDPRETIESLRNFFDSPLVDGAAVRTSWVELQPAAGRFEWTTLDAQISTAKSYGKKLTLHIIASSYAAPPAWVYERGAQSYQVRAPNGTIHTEPLPWDPVFLSSWQEFTAALAAHLKEVEALETVANISVAVPVPEMSLVGCLNGVLAQSPRIAYSRPDYLDAWRTSIRTMHSELPQIRKFVSAPVREICMPDHDGAAFYGEVLEFMKSLEEGRFAIFTADANALGSQRLANIAPLTETTPTAAQFIWSYSNDPNGRFQGPLLDSICGAHTRYGVRYFEVYKDDLRNPDPLVQEAISRIHFLEQCIP
ncbi:MAG: beta-galactosidase [Acidobacteria bacterium]|nr:beta-galactosidase [Acidobacteriota bacterium]